MNLVNIDCGLRPEKAMKQLVRDNFNFVFMRPKGDLKLYNLKSELNECGFNQIGRRINYVRSHNSCLTFERGNKIEYETLF